MASSFYCARCLNTFSDDRDACPNLSCGGPRPKAGWGLLLGEGDLLDRHYRITRPLAVGGAGLTYLAKEVDGDAHSAGPDLAIKVLYTQRDAGPFLRRLSNEAQILQELAHEHIVECRGFVQRAGHAPYLVTLFERGGSLAGHVEHHGALPAPVALSIIEQIARALEVAHQRGVIHRDLKPENVLLREPTARDEVPRIRVADFGIAKVFGGVGGRLTRLGAFVGTPEYAAPEQFEGMAPTPATDVWALGAVFYYLLTAQPPFTFKHRLDIEASYEELLSGAPPQLPAISGVGPNVQVLLDRMMQPNHGERYTVNQVLEAIRAIRGSESLRPAQSTLDLGTDAGNASRAALPPPFLAHTRDVTLELTEDGAPAARPRPEITGSMPAVREPTPERPPLATASPDADAPPPMTQPPPPPPVSPTKAAPTKPGPATKTPTPPAARMPAPPPPITPPPAKRSSGGVLGAMGAAGALVVLGGAVVVGLIALGGTAWYLGWFGTEDPVEADPVAVTPGAVIDLDKAAGADQIAAKEAIEDVLAKTWAPKIATTCDVHLVIDLHLQLDAKGALSGPPLERGSRESWRPCVAGQMRTATFPNELGAPLSLHTKLDLTTVK